MREDPTRPPVAETAGWSIEVAGKLVEYIRTYPWGERTPIGVDDCWIGEDLALCLRYRAADLLLGKRVSDLHLDVTGGGYAIDSATQAMYIFHDLYGPPLHVRCHPARQPVVAGEPHGQRGRARRSSRCRAPAVGGACHAMTSRSTSTLLSSR
jgi:hypothetical protein